jgi:hypothetical protein
MVKANFKKKNNPCEKEHKNIWKENFGDFNGECFIFSQDSVEGTFPYFCDKMQKIGKLCLGGDHKGIASLLEVKQVSGFSLWPFGCCKLCQWPQGGSMLTPYLSSPQIR